MSDFDKTADFGLGEWIVRPRLHRIEGQGSSEVLQLEPKVMETLCALAAEPGEVLGRDAMMTRIWPDVVVGEEVLTRCISELRRALGDDPRHPRYVETIRKGGYRLLEEPRALAPEAPGLKERGTRQRRAVSGGVALVMLVLAAFAVFMLIRDRGGVVDPTDESPAYESLPLTTYPGNELTQALSPDGDRVAFCWEGSDGEDLDIYIRRIDGELPLRITDHPDFEFSPIWSPDGGSLAFLRADSSGASLFTVPALGGTPRRRLHAEAGIGSLQWLEGERILLSAKLDRGHPFAHYLLHLESGELQTLGPAMEEGDDWRVVCAPDGERLAFIHLDSAGNPGLFLRDLSGGGAKRLTTDPLFPRTLVWARDGRSLIVAGTRQTHSRLWRLDIDSGEVTLLPFRGDELFMPTLARDRDRLVYQDHRRNMDIWRLAIGEDSEELPDERRFISSTRVEQQPDLATDGRVAFSSDRSGASEIWVCDADGGRPYRVTDTGDTLTLTPRWSPSTEWIAFEIHAEGRTGLHLVASSGGESRRLGPLDADFTLSGWRPDGRSLIAGMKTGEDWSLVEIDVATGELETLAENASYGLISGDGAWLTFARPREAGLWRRALPLGPVTKIAETYPAQGNGRGWRLCERGVLLFHHRPAQIRLMLLEPDSDWRVLKTWDQSISSQFACDAAGEKLLLVRSAEESTDLMLVDGFR